MRAKDVMTADVVTVGPDTDVRTIARSLIERGISAVPVVDPQGHVLGDPVHDAGAGDVDEAGDDGGAIYIDSATPDVAGRTLVRISGSVSRQVMNGGRETLTQSGQLDNRARGWRRITAADPCDFCAQVRDEGVHALDATFPAHDHCACTVAPHYGGPPSPRNREDWEGRP
jgi:hypothetical protein